MSIKPLLWAAHRWKDALGTRAANPCRFSPERWGEVKNSHYNHGCHQVFVGGGIQQSGRGSCNALACGQPQQPVQPMLHYIMDPLICSQKPGPRAMFPRIRSKPGSEIQGVNVQAVPSCPSIPWKGTSVGYPYDLPARLSD